MQVAFINASCGWWVMGGWGGGVFRRSKSASQGPYQLQLGLSKQKHKDRQAIPSSPPSLDTPAKPADFCPFLGAIVRKLTSWRRHDFSVLR